MSFLNALLERLRAPAPEPAAPAPATHERWADEEPQGRDVKKLFLIIGLGALSWVATYVGMLELIEANMGDLPLVHKLIIAFSVAMLMTMIIWLLDKMFSPVDGFTRACYIAGYIFLSVISVGFGFGFYWKVLESRGEASRSAESAITQVQSALFGAATRLEQLQSTLDSLTTVSSQKAEVERVSGKSCPNSGPGDGPRRKMREDDAARFKFASDFVKGRIGTVKTDMTALDGDLQKIVKDDRSVIDPKTGHRNEFLRNVGRKIELTVTGFNAFRTDPQLKQIRTELGDRAEKTTITGAKGVVISCPDAQLQMALRGVARAIDQLPELQKPVIAAVEGSEATIEAFRRLTTSFFGLLSFKLPPSADELRELQKKAVQSVEGSGSSGAPLAARLPGGDQAAGLAKRDYVPLAVAIFVDLCLLLVSIGRPMNRFVGMQRSMREAETGPVYPILSRFADIHADADAIRHFEVFREVIFDVNGQYHVAVPLYIPKQAGNYPELRREAQTLANLCYALEGHGILSRPASIVPALVVQRQLKRRGSKFVECFGNVHTPYMRRAGRSLKGLVYESARLERPAFKVYRFRKGAWPEMILHAVMGAPHNLDAGRGRIASERFSGPPGHVRANGHGGAAPVYLPDAPPLNGARHGGNGFGNGAGNGHDAAFGHYARYLPEEPDAEAPTAHRNGHLNGYGAHAASNGAAAYEAPLPAEDVDPGVPAAGERRIRGSLRDALARLLAKRSAQPEQAQAAQQQPPAGIEVEKISGWFERPKKDA